MEFWLFQHCSDFQTWILYKLFCQTLGVDLFPVVTLLYLKLGLHNAWKQGRWRLQAPSIGASWLREEWSLCQVGSWQAFKGLHKWPQNIYVGGYINCLLRKNLLISEQVNVEFKKEEFTEGFTIVPHFILSLTLLTSGFITFTRVLPFLYLTLIML